MAFFDSGQQRASALILLLGLVLVLTLLPYSSGLIGGLVLYVVFGPLYVQLSRRLPEQAAAGVIVALALILILGPTVVFTGLVVDQAQSIAGGVARGPLVDRLAQLRFGGYAIGPQLAGIGEQVLAWLGRSAFGLLGTATRIGLNLTIALFILYYLVRRPAEAWAATKPYIPFSPESAEVLRVRFHDVTVSTVIGTGLIATIQGMIVGFGFWMTGLPNALFWGVVTVVFAILPIVGSGLVIVPGILTLVLAERYGAAAVLGALALIAGNIDVVIRPMVFRRYAQIHPLVTLIGAIGGVSYFGLLGLLIGPLLVSYFFELLRIYQAEYHRPLSMSVRSGSAVPPVLPPPPA